MNTCSLTIHTKATQQVLDEFQALLESVPDFGQLSALEPMVVAFKQRDDLAVHARYQLLLQTAESLLWPARNTFIKRQLGERARRCSDYSSALEVTQLRLRIALLERCVGHSTALTSQRYLRLFDYEISSATECRMRLQLASPVD